MKTQPNSLVLASPDPMPHSIEAEEGLLACCLHSSDAIGLCIQMGITRDSFYAEKNKVLFTSLLDLYEEHESFDEIVVYAHLEKIGEAHFFPSGFQDIFDLSCRVETPIHAKYYAKEIQSRYIKRRLMRIAREAIESCVNEADSGELAQQLVYRAEELSSAYSNLFCGSDLFENIKDIIDAGFEPEMPSVGAFEGDDGCLIYRGRVNEIHGEPSVGKTNIELAIAVGELNQGRDVLFLDPEDTATAIVRRLVSLGADKAKVIEHFKYVQDPTPDDIKAAIRWTEKQRPSLVIVDGLAELLSAQGLSENEPTDILKFLRQFVQPFATAGAAVLLSDHVVKSSESRGGWSRGSGAKMGRYDGVSFEVRLAKPYSPTQSGGVRLYVAKDRNGGVGPKGALAAEVQFRILAEGVTEVAIVKASEETDFRPTEYMEKVSGEIEKNPKVTKRGLRTLGTAKYVDIAIQRLENEGYIKVTKGGPGKPNTYKSLRPFIAHKSEQTELSVSPCFDRDSTVPRDTGQSINGTVPACPCL